MDVLNPATGEVIAAVAECDAADVDDAVAAARAAFPGWRRTTPGERGELLLALADAVDEACEELAALESANVGKPLDRARAPATKSLAAPTACASSRGRRA
jgi:aminobutyraldehyde dehydrogenase